MRSECQRSSTVKPQLFTSFSAMTAATLAHTCRFMLTTGPQRRTALNAHCGTLVDVGEPVTARSIGLVVPRGWPHFAPLSHAILDLLERHEHPPLEEFLEDASTCDPPQFPTLPFRRLRMFFVLAFLSCAGMALVMIIDPQTPH